jgi:transcription initiation factor TFIID subunit 11
VDTDAASDQDRQGEKERGEGVKGDAEKNKHGENGSDGTEDGGEGPVKVVETAAAVDSKTNSGSNDESKAVVNTEKDKSTSPAVLPDGDPNSSDERAAKDSTSVAALPKQSQSQTDSTTTLPNGSSKLSKKRKAEDKDEKLLDALPDDFGRVEPGAWGLSNDVEDCDRGPLLPDHLREALRRYRRSRSGGSVGFTGISLEGRDRVAPKMGGRRLFK